MRTTPTTFPRASLWKRRILCAVAFAGILSTFILRGEELKCCLRLTPEIRLAQASDSKAGYPEFEQSNPPLWLFYKKDHVRVDLSYHDTYYEPSYSEEVSWNEHASYVDTIYPDGYEDAHVPNATTEIHRMADDLDE